MKLKLRLIILIVLQSVMSMTAMAGIGFHIDSVSHNMSRQLYEYPQEKIHVTTDQSRYIAGDTIWLRAWLVDAASHRQVTATKFVYLELLNPFGEVTRRIKLRQQEGAFTGYIPLDEDMAEGDYTLLSYTTFMQGPGEDYYFRKVVKVISPYSMQAKIHTEYEYEGADLRIRAMFQNRLGEMIHHEEGILTTGGGKEYKSLPGRKEVSYKLSPEHQAYGVAKLRFDNYEKFIVLPSKDDANLDVQFFPEGGYTVPGVVNKIGIKAIDSGGRGVELKGTVVDSQDNIVTEFTTIHRGMGVLNFIPEASETYECKVNKGGKELRYPLPISNQEAAILQVENMSIDYSMVTARGNLPEHSGLVVLNRGRVQYAGAITRDARIQFPREALGEGIIQYLLLDNGGKILSERLAYGNYADSTRLVAEAECQEGKLSLSLKLPEGVEGDVSVSVLDRRLKAQSDTTTNIEAQLLLQSDIRGYIEDPGYYFRHKDRHSRYALDALLLTQGWSRYDVAKAITGTYAEPTSAIEIGTEFTGKVKSLWKGKPLSEARVTAIGPKSGFISEAKTDAEGNFVMTGPDFPEGTQFIFQAFNKKGKTEMNFEIDVEHFSKLLPIAGKRSSIAELAADDASDEETEWSIAHKNGAMSVTLADVRITRRRKEPSDIYEALSDKSFDTDYFKEQSITSYEEVLRRIAGIRITNGEVFYRDNPVVFFVDNMVWKSSFDADKKSMFSEIGYSVPRSKRMRYANSGRLPIYNSYMMGDRLMKMSVGAMSRTKTLSQLSEFESQYPFHTMKRIEFLRPGASLVIGQSAGFSGALVFMTKTGFDMSNSWEQPPHLQVKNPLGYQRPVEFYVPKYSHGSDYDFGSTIYWNPKVKFGGVCDIEIAVPKADSKLTVNIEGIDSEGFVINQSFEK